MSGIYIPMKMPKSCNECRFFVDAWCYALEVDDWRNAYNKPQEGKRLDGCPLIPVPDHGRLIDGDELYEKFILLESEAMGALQTTGIGSVDGIKWSAILTERTGYKFDIVDAPTIIPADLPVMYYPQVDGITPTIIPESGGDAE